MSKQITTVTPSDYFQMCRNLAEVISISGVKYDTILGIGRGGFLPAEILSRWLDIPMAVVMAKSRSDIGESQEVVLSQIASLVPIGSNILIVDEIIDSGATIKAVKKKLDAMDRTYDVACVYAKPGKEPEFFSRIANEGEWIVFPQEVK